MAKQNDFGQYPLKLHCRYKVIQGIAGLDTGEIVQVVGLRSELQREEARNIFVTIERSSGIRKEMRLNMGTGMAKIYFELLP